MRGAGWLIVLLVVAAAGYLWWRHAPQTLPAFVTPPARAPENPALFKWRDAQGQWHITDSPPADRPFERIVVDPDTNVVPSTLPATDAPPAEATPQR